MCSCRHLDTSFSVQLLISQSSQQIPGPTPSSAHSVIPSSIFFHSSPHHLVLHQSFLIHSSLISPSSLQPASLPLTTSFVCLFTPLSSPFIPSSTHSLMPPSPHHSFILLIVALSHNTIFLHLFNCLIPPFVYPSSPHSSGPGRIHREPKMIS